MKYRFLAACMVSCLLAVSSLAIAQAPPMGGFPAGAVPQSDVTFHVPLNLTQLAADITKVAVVCAVFDPRGSSNSPRLGQTWHDENADLFDDPVITAFSNSTGFGIWGGEKVEVPVERLDIPAPGGGVTTSGAVITTASVIVTITDTQGWTQADHFGDELGYFCALEGFSGQLQRWEMFDAAHAIAVFRLSPTPDPISGDFVW